MNSDGSKPCTQLEHLCDLFASCVVAMAEDKLSDQEFIQSMEYELAGHRECQVQQPQRRGGDRHESCYLRKGNAQRYRAENREVRERVGSERREAHEVDRVERHEFKEHEVEREGDRVERCDVRERDRE